MQTTAVVIGAGHAGLAMSRRLTERSIDHVVLERGEVANSWRTQRWPSLRLLTPNWQTRLPGHDYAGDDPDGFMPVADVVATLDPLRPSRRRTGAHRNDGTFRARRTGGIRDPGQRRCPLRPGRGAGDRGVQPASDPGRRRRRPPDRSRRSPRSTYRDPGQLPDGGVLVVGASATGVQLAGEIHRSGRPVTLAVGEHVRLPRSYRGRDIFWWLEATGLLAERYDQIDDLTRARHLPSPQLTGTPEAVTTDLNTLTALGIRIVGRLGRIADGVAQFSGSLANTCALADLKMNRFLNRADQWATTSGLDDELPPPHRFAPTRVDPRTPLELDLTSGEITTVLWATGFRPDHSWLDIPVRDRTGRIRHDGGVVTGAPGLYLLGMPVLRTRASTYIHGAAADSERPGRPPALLPQQPAPMTTRRHAGSASVCRRPSARRGRRAARRPARDRARPRRRRRASRRDQPTAPTRRDTRPRQGQRAVPGLPVHLRQPRAGQVPAPQARGDQGRDHAPDPAALPRRGGGVDDLLHVPGRDVLADDRVDDRGGEPLAQPALGMRVLAGPLPLDREAVRGQVVRDQALPALSQVRGLTT